MADWMRFAAGGALAACLLSVPIDGFAQGVLGPGSGSSSADQVAEERDQALRAEVAESILAAREAAAGRRFDAGYRSVLKADLVSRSLEQLERLQGSGAGADLRATESTVVANALGDTSADLVFSPVTPCRVLDTRFSAGGILSPGAPQAFKVAGASTDFSAQGGSASGCGVPTGATAVAVNFGATQSAGPGNLRAYAWNSTPPAAPNASVVNYGNLAAAGLVTVPNGAIVPLCNPAATTCTNDLFLEAFVSATHMVADVTGYFAKTDAASLTRVASNTTAVNTGANASVPATNLLTGINAPRAGGLLVNVAWTCASFTGSAATRWDINVAVDGANVQLVVHHIPARVAGSAAGGNIFANFFRPVAAGTHAITWSASRAGDSSMDCNIYTTSQFVPFNNAGATP
jgi:hypothetical protein